MDKRDFRNSRLRSFESSLEIQKRNYRRERRQEKKKYFNYKKAVATLGCALILLSGAAAYGKGKEAYTNYRIGKIVNHLDPYERAFINGIIENKINLIIEKDFRGYDFGFEIKAKEIMVQEAIKVYDEKLKYNELTEKANTAVERARDVIKAHTEIASKNDPVKVFRTDEVKKILEETK